MTKTQLIRITWSRSEITPNIRILIVEWIEIGYDVSSLESFGLVVLKKRDDRVTDGPCPNI